MNKLPITLIAGFLGSGKTTFLQKHINENKNKNILYLINDFSANDVDGIFLKKNEINLRTILGGSIFCNCLITEFTETLNSILNLKNHFEEIIIETSGITNPLSANKMLKESQLNEQFFIKRIISIVDSTNFLKLEKSLSNIHNQIIAADIIIINKIDLIYDNKINEIQKKVKSINPNADILFSEFCKIDFNSLKNYNIKKQLEFSTKKSEKYSRLSFKSKKNLNYEKLKGFVSNKKELIFRVKGFVNINDAPHSINYSGSGWLIKKITKNVNPSLEFIFLNKNKERINQILRKGIFFKK